MLTWGGKDIAVAAARDCLISGCYFPYARGEWCRSGNSYSAHRSHVGAAGRVAKLKEARASQAVLACRGIGAVVADTAVNGCC